MTEKKTKAPPEQWQIDDAARLAKLFSECDESQAAFGARVGIGNQSMVQQYLSCKRTLNLRAVIKFANGLNVTVDQISKTLADELRQAKLHAQQSAPQNEAHQLFNQLTEENKARIMERMLILLENQKDERKSNKNLAVDYDKKRA